MDPARDQEGTEPASDKSKCPLQPSLLRSSRVPVGTEREVQAQELALLDFKEPHSFAGLALATVISPVSQLELSPLLHRPTSRPST